GIQAVLNNYNYPGTSPPMGTVGPLVQAALDSSAASLQGATGPAGKARRRCIDTIGRVRSKIVHQVLARAIRCQRAIDRTATSFGLISPTCLVAAQNVAARARTIVQACAGFSSGFLIFNFLEIPFERIRFDCVSDAPLTRAAFPCTISKMVNQIGGDLPPSGQPECKVTLPQ